MKKLIGVVTKVAVLLAAIIVARIGECDEIKTGRIEEITDSNIVSVSVVNDLPGNVYITSSKNLYKTEVFFKNYKNIFNAGSGNKISCVRQDPVKSNICYLATDRGLYKTYNDGESWARIFSSSGNATKNAVFVEISNKHPNIIFLGTTQGLYKSTDYGKNWVLAKGGLNAKTEIRQIISGNEDKVIYIATDKGIYRSEDYGENWELIFSSIEFKDNNLQEGENDNSDIADTANEETEAVFQVKSISFNEGVLYIGTNRGVFRIKEKNTEKIPNHGLIGRNINKIINTADGNLLVGTEKGCFLYDEKENLWHLICEQVNGVKINEIKETFYKNKRYVFIGTQNGAYIFENPVLNEPKQISEDNSLEPQKLPLSRFQNEPTIKEIQNKAVEYAEVHPEKIKNWRKLATQRALLPKVSFDVDYGLDETYEIYTSASTSYTVNGPRDRSWNVGVSATWDLADLIWNESQTSIDVRSKLMVQLRDDILNEVTRYYFERKRLINELSMNPPKDEKAKAEKELKLEELTANIDALTGGYFSAKLQELEGR